MCTDCKCVFHVGSGIASLSECWLQYLGSKEVKKLVGLESTKDSIAKMKVSFFTLTVSTCRTGLVVGDSAHTCSATLLCVDY